MRPILSRVLRQASPPEPIAAGTYHYQAPAEAAIPYRLHLRVDEKGDGLLIVNASTILHLNATATAHAYEVVRGASAKEGATAIAQRYRVAKRQARADHEQLRQKLTAIATAPDVDPVLYYGLERAEPYTLPTSAPFRLDLALTYAMDPDGALDPLARRRVDRELTTVEWKQVLDKAWQAGIPHVTFTGGEPTRREDLVKLIAHAESLGQVAGLVTQGRRLSDPSFMARLEQAGLDHLLIVLEPSDASSMSGLRNALASEVYAAAHLTLSHEDWQGKIGLLAQLREQGLGAISISA
ncbi:MAG TPA: radical SAM protein, partial [Anaerolineales bacterium]|nr:radical SAM protein [Anaerolineales bacterium]